MHTNMIANTWTSAQIHLHLHRASFTPIILVYHRNFLLFVRALVWLHSIRRIYICWLFAPLLVVHLILSIRPKHFFGKIPANGKCLNNKFDHLFWYSYGNSMIIYFKSERIMTSYWYLCEIVRISDVCTIVASTY